MSMAMLTLTAGCDRHCISNRAVASTATAKLQDMQMMSQDNRSKVIDRGKEQRERHKIHEEFSRFCVNFC